MNVINDGVEPSHFQPLPWVKVQTEVVPIPEKEGEDICQQR